MTPAARNGTYLQRIRKSAKSDRTNIILVQPCFPSGVESAPLKGFSDLKTD